MLTNGIHMFISVPHCLLMYRGQKKVATGICIAIPAILLTNKFIISTVASATILKIKNKLLQTSAKKVKN